MDEIILITNKRRKTIIVYHLERKIDGNKCSFKSNCKNQGEKR